ncbi:MAG: chromate transporter [Clostridia bacterium]|nr:chromate transporter [Clostridia bacterium]
MEQKPSITPESKAKQLWTLFWVSLRISAFTFGGGFVIVGFMKRQFVDRLHWLKEDEMLDYTALAQTAPGPIAVNAAVLVGRHVAGGWGMLAAVLGTVIPPIALLSIISLFYNAFAANRYIALLLRGFQAGVAAVVLDVACSLGMNVLKNRSWLHDALIAIAFLATFVLHIPVIWIILGGMVLGLALALWEKRRAA